MPGRSWVTGRAYNVIDADGHILKPLDLWGRYVDPTFRGHAPKAVKGERVASRGVVFDDRGPQAARPTVI